MHAAVILENGTLLTLASNAEAVREFPFLTRLRPRASVAATGGRRGCGKCRQSNRATSDVFNQVKASFCALSTAKKRRLRELLDTKTVRVIWRDGRGRTNDRVL